MRKTNSEKKVVIYCRESRDDYGENYERIETQRDLLIKYCKTHGYTNIIDIIMDDDKSGTDFRRFQDIRNKAKNRKLDVIVFKNSARLGRNQKESLDFVEYLEENGVEIIFEDEQYNEEMFGLYAWFNERRARDDSKNIRRNLKHKIEEGQLLVKAIYGYNKRGNNLVVNEETSKIVKEIFELYSKGWGYRKIAIYLNKKGILTPSQVRNFKNAKKAISWNVQHISRILSDRRYIGDYVGGYTEKISFKSKKTRVKAKEEWTIIEKHHEPIIEKELFEKVQKIIEKHRIKENNKFQRYEYNVYSGLLYCGKCGKLMYKRKETRKRPDGYICSKYSNEGTYKGENGCTSHRIRTEYIDEIVKSYIEKILNNEDMQNFVVKNVKVIHKGQFETKLNNDKKNLEKIKKQYKQIYEDKLNELIPDFLYQEKKQELEKNIKLIQDKISENQKNINMVNIHVNKKEIVLQTIEEIKKYGLRKEEIYNIFEKIIVFEPKEIRKQEKDLYNVYDMMYNKLYENEGLFF